MVLLLVAVEKHEWTFMLEFLLGLFLLFWCLGDFVGGGTATGTEDDDAPELHEEAEDENLLLVELSPVETVLGDLDLERKNLAIFLDLLFVGGEGRTDGVVSSEI
jgi:hypothetical protein